MLTEVLQSGASSETGVANVEAAAKASEALSGVLQAAWQPERPARSKKRAIRNSMNVNGCTYTHPFQVKPMIPCWPWKSCVELLGCGRLEAFLCGKSGSFRGQRESHE